MNGVNGGVNEDVDGVAVIDEFTSHLDRATAIRATAALIAFWREKRREGGARLVLATVHADVLWCVCFVLNTQTPTTVYTLSTRPL